MEARLREPPPVSERLFYLHRFALGKKKGPFPQRTRSRRHSHIITLTSVNSHEAVAAQVDWVWTLLHSGRLSSSRKGRARQMFLIEHLPVQTDGSLKRFTKMKKHLAEFQSICSHIPDSTVQPQGGAT